MARKRPSSQKRQREFQKRQRELKKAEKAAQKRERRLSGEEPAPAEPFADDVVATSANVDEAVSEHATPLSDPAPSSGD